MQELFMSVFNKAKTSGFYLWLFNFILHIKVPFNKPHNIRFTKITDDSLESWIPYKRSNYNHLKGLHACALATIAEYTSGILLISKLDPAKYRLIMQTLEINYLKQGKKDAKVKLSINNTDLQEKILNPLQNNDSINFKQDVEVFDVEGIHLCTATVNWQIKDWQKVRMK